LTARRCRSAPCMRAMALALAAIAFQDLEVRRVS
jgi:hypothetical protein